MLKSSGKKSYGILKNLKVQNFQKHRQFRIDLSHPITTIVGRSDVGKSAIFRALRWLCLNTPSGSEFIREGSKEVRVRLDVEDVTIRRHKGVSNLYGLDGKKYVSFGTKVPNPVAQKLNVIPENFQGQHDPPYWLTLSPGLLAKELNRIVDLEIMDHSIAHVAKQLRQTKAKEEVVLEELKQKREERDSLKWTKEALTQAEELDKLRKNLETDGANLASKERLLQRVSTQGDHIKRVGGLAEGGFLAVSAGRDALNTAQEVDKLSDLLNTLASLRRKTCRLQQQKKRKTKELTRYQARRCPLCGRTDRQS